MNKRASISLVGKIVVFNSRAWEVLTGNVFGDLYVQQVSTLERRWIDYFMVDVLDPALDGDSLLTSLGSLAQPEGNSPGE